MVQVINLRRKLQSRLTFTLLRNNVARFIFVTTPGRYAVSLIVLTILMIASSAVTILSITEKRQIYNQVLDHTIRLNATSRDLYTSLSDMDVVTAEISVDSTLNQALVNQLHADINTASQSLVYIGEEVDATDNETFGTLKKLGNAFQLYIQKISPFLESNQKPNASGLILQQISQLSDRQILPAAAILMNRNLSILNEETARATTIPYLPLALLFITAIGLAIIILLIRNSSSRSLNPGLLLALLCIIIQFGWLVVAGITGNILGNQSRSLGITDLSSQTKILVSGQQARRDELLRVSLPYSHDTYNRSFVNNIDQIIDSIRDSKPQIISSQYFLVNAAHSVHKWAEAAKVMYTSTPTSLVATQHNNDNFDTQSYRAEFLVEANVTAPQWNSFLAEVHNAINKTAQEYASSAQTSYNVWRHAVTVVFFTGFLGFFASILGVYARLKEYR